MAFQAHNYVLDDTLKLTAAVTYTAASGTEVAGTVASIDLGQVAPAFNVNTSSYAPFARYAVVVDIGTIDVTIGGTYRIWLEGADTADFLTGRTRLSETFLGSAGNVGTEFDTPANSRRVLYIDNVSYGSSGTSSGTAAKAKRFVRIRFHSFYSSGSASCQILNAWLVPLQ